MMPKRHLVAIAAGAGLILAGCGADEPGDTAAASGLEYGASVEEWNEAFEDMEPITLHSQVLYAEGDLNNQQYLDYFDAVEEYSDGAITFDVAYASGVAPYEEVYQAITDGRLDIGISSPSFMPVEFPAYSAWTDLGGALGPKGAFPGVLHTYSWTAAGMLDNSQINDEFEDYGLKLLHPFTYAGYDQGIICTEEHSTLDDFQGSSIVVSTPSQSRLAEAIGMNPVSLPFPEWYDAIQRGVADCASNTITSAYSLGLFDVAPHVTIDEDVFFGNLGQGALAINNDVWEDLPLVAQQLLFDMLPEVTYAAIEQTNFQRIIDALESQEQISGSTLQDFDEDALEELLEVQGETFDIVAESGELDYTREELEALVEQLIDDWDETISDFGYPTITYSEVVSEWDSSSVDLELWNNAFFEEVLLPHRPS